MSEPSTYQSPSKLGLVWGFLSERKKWWLAPMIIVLLSFSLVIFLSAGTAVAPFIYTLF